MDNNKLIALRKELKWGDTRFLAKITGTSPATVSLVLRGARNNPNILQAAFELLNERKKQEEYINQEAEKL